MAQSTGRAVSIFYCVVPNHPKHSILTNLDPTQQGVSGDIFVFRIMSCLSYKYFLSSHCIETNQSYIFIYYRIVMNDQKILENIE